MWLFHHKYLADGTLSRYKARLVANGNTQLKGIDVDETFSPVVKPDTIRTVLSLTTSRHWRVHQIDVKNAFFCMVIYLSTVYMHQPSGLQDSAHSDYVCLLQRHGTDTTYLLLYVDDIVLTASSETFFVTRDSFMMFLSQRKYVVEILERAHIVNCNHSRTPVNTESKLGDDGDMVSDLTLYRSLAALKRILRYVRGTLDYGLQLISSSTTSLVAYSDADWAGCPTTRRSTSGYYVFLDNNLLSWLCKHQPALSRSSAEAEYRGVANVVTETCWLRNLLRELHTPLYFATLVHCDNISVVYLSSNPVRHQRTKHIEIDIYFVRDLVVAGQVRVLHVPSRYRWQKKMHFLLTTLKVVYVLTTPMPELLEDATVEAIRIRAKWENDDYICRGHILNDRGVNIMIPGFFQSVAIIHETTAPYTPQQKGPYKRHTGVRNENLGEKGLIASMLDMAEKSHSKAYRPKDIYTNVQESQMDDHTDDVPNEIPEPRRGKRAKKAKSYGSDFQLYLVKGSREQDGLQYSNWLYYMRKNPRTKMKLCNLVMPCFLKRSN
ncbi:ribonuclease H-like domain-containing protein [Tanacetum coccineum]